MARRAAAARRGRHEDEQRRHDEDARNEASSGGATTTSGGGGATNGRSERKPNRMVDHSPKAPLHNVDSMGQTHTRTCTQLTVTNAVYARGGTARQRQLAGLVQLRVVVRGGTRTSLGKGRPKSKIAALEAVETCATTHVVQQAHVRERRSDLHRGCKGAPFSGSRRAVGAWCWAAAPAHGAAGVLCAARAGGAGRRT